LYPVPDRRHQVRLVSVKLISVFSRLTASYFTEVYRVRK